MSHFSYATAGPGGEEQHRVDRARAVPGRWPKSEGALAVVNRDLMATLPGADALILVAGPPPRRPSSPGARGTEQIYVAMADGRWHGNAVNVCDLEEGEPAEPQDATVVLTVVADAAQTTVMELLRQVWPVCPEHRIGMHPRPAGTTRGWHEGETGATGHPVWWCRGAPDGACHDVAAVGELAAGLPGRQRRALRRGRRVRGDR
ncbi:hypothetical protein [Streptomyces sp. NPDC086010]|uniref:hypothetical protein n=1 Tax=Streptomyces sp. NPDC086010 TaxID=3365745 RepID=UPI0037CE4A7D